MDELHKVQMGGCPGSAMRQFKSPASEQNASNENSESQPSQLAQWPVQLTLVPPHAPYFKDADDNPVWYVYGRPIGNIVSRNHRFHLLFRCWPNPHKLRH